MKAKTKIKGPGHAGSDLEAAAVFADLDRRLYWQDHPEARPANAGPPGPRYTPDEMTGLELRRYLVRVCRERLRQGLALGSLDGWARAIAYVTAKCDATVSVIGAARHAERVGIQIPDDILGPIVAEAAAAKAAGVLRYSARLMGEMLQLTAAERDEYQIRRFIDACDEAPKDRARRKKAEQRRARGATPRSVSAAATKPWVDAGVSRRTWYRRMALKRPGTQYLSVEEECSDELVPNPRCSDELVPTDGGDDA